MMLVQAIIAGAYAKNDHKLVEEASIRVLQVRSERFKLQDECMHGHFALWKMYVIGIWKDIDIVSILL